METEATVECIDVYFSPKQLSNPETTSPSPRKPEFVVADWIEQDLPIRVVEPVPRESREHRRRGEQLARRAPAVEVLHQEGERGHVVQVRVRQDDPPDPPLRRQGKRFRQGPGVQRRVAVDQERRHAVPGRGTAEGPEDAD